VPLAQKNSVSLQWGEAARLVEKNVSHRAAVLDFKDFFKIFLESIEFDS